MHALQSVEAQFERAMQKVAEYRSRMTMLSEGFESVRAELKTTQVDLDRARKERDLLSNEVEESRAALEEIRRSLVGVTSDLVAGEGAG